MLRGWIRSNPRLTEEARVWKNWMIVYLVFQVGLWLPFFLTFVGIDKSLTYDLVQTTGAAWLVVSSFLLLLYPSILFEDGHKSSRKKKASDVQNQDQIKLQELWITISKALDNQDLFLRPGYTINEFSKDIGIPVYQISKCISQFEGLGFIDMINKKRISYCVFRLDSGEWKNFKLEAIAHECGFNNRNSFTNAFKKFKGLTPSEYKASIEPFSSEK
jgi:AraC-like DNA-binding protein